MMYLLKIELNRSAFRHSGNLLLRKMTSEGSRRAVGLALSSLRGSFCPRRVPTFSSRRTEHNRLHPHAVKQEAGFAPDATSNQSRSRLALHKNGRATSTAAGTSNQPKMEAAARRRREWSPLKQTTATH